MDLINLLITIVILPQALYKGIIGAALVLALARTDTMKERPT